MSRRTILLAMFWVFISVNLAAVNPGILPLKKRGRVSIEDFRIGGGVGYGFYLSNQMDYQITRNYGDFNEVNRSYYPSVYMALSRSWEIGLTYRNARLLTLKSVNTQGSDCDFQDAQFMVAYSFNRNIRMDKSRYTINGQLGLGGIYFRSKYYTVNTEARKIDRIFASVGYNGNIVSLKDQKEKQAAVIGHFGLTLGYRLFRNVSVYFENTVNISTSNKMSGNLHKHSWIPPDGYFYSGLALYINFTSRRDMIGCPKF